MSRHIIAVATDEGVTFDVEDADTTGSAVEFGSQKPPTLAPPLLKELLLVLPFSDDKDTLSSSSVFPSCQIITINICS